MNEQIYLIIANIISIEFPNSKTLEKLIIFFDLNNINLLENIFKVIYRSLKCLVKEIKKNKPNFMKFLEELFLNKGNVYKNFLNLALVKLQEYGASIENSDDLNLIDNIVLILNENIFKFSLKLLNLEMKTSAKIPLDSILYIKHMETLQNLGI